MIRSTDLDDPFTPAERSEHMSKIRAKNTKPEVLLRSALHNAGLRFRIHRKDLPGTPDIVLPRYRTAIFVHGCFWHGHDCHLFKLPKTRTEFWAAKIEKNRLRDQQNVSSLLDANWRVICVWECALKKTSKRATERVADQIAGWLKTKETLLEIDQLVPLS